MMKMLHVGAAQIHSGGALEETLARMETQIRAASAVGVEVLLFAECVLGAQARPCSNTSRTR